MGGKLRSLLRESTANAHSRLDEALSSHEISTTGGYGGFLSAQARALLPLEQALEQAHVERFLPDWASRTRSISLRNDLRELGVEVPATLSIDLPATDAATLLGIAYVLEGSRLGARYIVKRIPGSAQAHAASFLSHGSDGRLWQTFLETLEGNAAAKADEAALKRGALFAFSIFQSAAISGELTERPAPHAFFARAEPQPAKS